MNPALQQTTFDKFWRAVEERWDDDKAHRLFLEFASEKSLLMEAAARYRAAAEKHDVSRHLETIRARALTMLAQQSSERPPRRRAVLYVAAFAGGVLFLWLLLSLAPAR